MSGSRLGGVGAWLQGAWGRGTLAFLWMAVLSGVALAPFWRGGQARESLELLDGGLPWGWWIRGLHVWSAEGALVCTLLHSLDIVARRGEGRIPPGAWTRSVLLLPAMVAAMASGFLMRGDASAQAAREVLRGVLATIPAVGEFLSTMLLGADGDLTVVGLQHAGLFTLVLVAVTPEHARRTWSDGPALAFALCLSAALAGLFARPLDGTPATGEVLRGPWVLWGLQGLLGRLPAWTGWALPVLGVGGLAILPRVRRPWGRRGLLLALGLLVLAWIAGSLEIAGDGTP